MARHCRLICRCVVPPRVPLYLLVGLSVALGCGGVNLETGCPPYFEVEFGQVPVAGEYEFRATASGAVVGACKMRLGDIAQPACNQFSFGEGRNLVWTLDGSLAAVPVVSVSVSRDGVLLGTRNFITAEYRAAVPDWCATFARFSFVTGEPVPPR